MALLKSHESAAASVPFGPPEVRRVLRFDDTHKDERMTAETVLAPDFQDNSFERALNDWQGRIDPEFRVPQSYRAMVGFWLRIYTLYTTQHLVIFDSLHPELIYEVLDFRGLAKTARNRMVYEILEERRAHKTVAAYRDAFRRLSANPKPKSPTREERNILRALSRCHHRHSIRELAGNMKMQRGQRDNIIRGILVGDAFFPKMEGIFKSMGLPPQLTRLTLVESSFNYTAISRVGAAGVWQFMPASATEYLVVDAQRRVDERLSPLKSTVAAAKLLRRNLKILGNWPLAVTSYNHGTRHLPKAGTPDSGRSPYRLLALCSKTSPLGWASKNYFAEFLAVLHAEAYRDLFYGQSPAAPLHSLVYEALAQEQTADAVARAKGISLEEFLLFNSDIRDPKARLPKGYLIAVPGPRDDFRRLFRPDFKIKRSNRRIVARS